VDTQNELRQAAQPASLTDETPEGRSIVVLAKEKYGLRGRDMKELNATFIPFTAQTRMSGIDAGSSSVRKGAVDAILNYVDGGGAVRAVASGNVARALQSGVVSDAAREVQAISDEVAKAGGTPLGVAMNTGTQAAREAGNMVDLDSNPTKLIEVVEIGKQLLMTRGALTTFSIANDVAKYFAIIPAMFLAFYPQLEVLNVMHLASPQSAILSAIIFNALVIIALIPLALKGVAYRAVGAGALLRRNLLIYGLGGIIVPFIGIKSIDL